MIKLKSFQLNYFTNLNLDLIRLLIREAHIKLYICKTTLRQIKTIPSNNIII